LGKELKGSVAHGVGCRLCHRWGGREERALAGDGVYEAGGWGYMGLRAMRGTERGDWGGAS